MNANGTHINKHNSESINVFVAEQDGEKNNTENTVCRYFTHVWNCNVVEILVVVFVDVAAVSVCGAVRSLAVNFELKFMFEMPSRGRYFGVQIKMTQTQYYIAVFVVVAFWIVKQVRPQTKKEDTYRYCARENANWKKKTPFILFSRFNAR